MEHLRDDVRATATHDPANISSTYDSNVTPEPNKTGLAMSSRFVFASRQSGR
jgi:hypothetical protein